MTGSMNVFLLLGAVPKTYLSTFSGVFYFGLLGISKIVNCAIQMYYSIFKALSTSEYFSNFGSSISIKK